MSAIVFDSTAVVGRHLLRMKHAPAIPVMTQTMPVVFLLFFGYVFGPERTTGPSWSPACSWRPPRTAS
jgi:hypothetical protein